MKSTVEQVVSVLDEIGVVASPGDAYYETIKLIEKNRISPFYDRQRVLHSRIPKKRPVRKMRSAKTTGEFNIHNKVKERIRKNIKKHHPNDSLKFNTDRKKWEVKAKEVTQRKEEIENEHHLNQLYEITIRTGAIAIWIATVKKWANRVDSLANSMKQKASTFDSADTLEKRNKIDKELWTIKSESDKALRKMLMYGSLISAAGGLGIVKNYKEIKKQLSKRRK